MTDRQPWFSDTASSMLTVSVSRGSVYSATSTSQNTLYASDQDDIDRCGSQPHMKGAKAIPPANLDALQAERPGYGTCSVPGAAMNLVNAIMGTGIIGLPLALYCCGFWFGLACSVFVAWISCVSMVLMVHCGIRTEQYSLTGLAYYMMGPIGAHAVNAVLLFHTALTAISYYILMGDTLPGLLHYYFPTIPLIDDRRYVIVCFGLIVILPLSLPRSPASLTKWSTVSVLLLPLILVGILARVPAYAPPLDQLELNFINVSPNLFNGVAIMALSMGCSQNVFGIYLGQRDQRPTAWLGSSTLAISIAYLTNIMFAIAGYICFGKQLQANVLLNFPVDDAAINLVRFLLGIFMVFTIPLCIYPCRECVMTLTGRNTHGRMVTQTEHQLGTLAIFLVTLYYGSTVTSLGRVFTIIGGLSTTALGFLLPGAAYLYIFLPGLLRGKEEDMNRPLLALQHVNGSWKNATLSATMILFSLPIMYFALRSSLEF